MAVRVLAAIHQHLGFVLIDSCTTDMGPFNFTFMDNITDQSTMREEKEDLNGLSTMSTQTMFEEGDSGLGMDELDLSFNSSWSSLMEDNNSLEQEPHLAPPRKRRRTDSGCDVTEVPGCSPVSEIIHAVDRLSTDTNLVADGTRRNCLPTITDGKHKDLNAITPETMVDVLEGHYDNQIDHVTIIDCRYPYEYEGGHIQGAVNLYTKDSIQAFLNNTPASPSNVHVLIFHCEFSSERGPKMCRFLRSLDRELNKESYPRLNFPEVYLLEGGYKDFYNTNKSLCEPQKYTPMLHKEHTDDLRHFRVKSKSWSAGDKPRRRPRTNGGLRLSF